MTLHGMCVRSNFTLVAILVVISTIDGRSLPGDSSPLISDGVARGHDQHGEPSKLLLLRGTAGVLDDEVEVCEQMYGFLPCSYSTAGHLFLILVYEYLLFHGESYVASGSEQIFKMLGPGIFGASAFHVLGVLPEALILLGGRVCALGNCFSKKQKMDSDSIRTYKQRRGGAGICRDWCWLAGRILDPASDIAMGNLRPPW